MSKNTLSFFQESDKKFVYKHLLSCYNRKIVCAEVGNYTGNSTRFFAENIPTGSTFYSVDNQWHNIDVPNSVIRVTSASLDWSAPPLDFIYLDGDHDEDVVYAEIEKFSKVTNVIAGHDAKLVQNALLAHVEKRDVPMTLLIDNQSSSWIIRYD